MSLSTIDRVDPRTPQARLARFFDPDTLSLFAVGDPSGVVAGQGLVGGNEVVAFATDPTVQGGAMGRDGCARIVHAIESAVRMNCPVVGIWHSGGARLQEGVASLDGVGRIFAATVRASGRIPQLSLVLGAAAGGAAYGPALTDIVIMGPGAKVFVTGPDVVRSVTGEECTADSLGGPDVHSRRSGVVHVTCDSEDEAVERTRAVAVLLADQRDIGPVTGRELGELLPDNPRRAYDVRPLVKAVLDDEDEAVELHPRWAPNIVTVLGRLGGRTIGVVANNPLRRGGCLDATSAEKASRFVRMCDSFGVPLVVLVDVPGYLPGVGQEWEGVVRRGAKLLYAFSECTVPRVTVVTRKAYGGAYIAMNASSLGATAVYAWPTAQVAVMGAEAAVGILHRRKLAEVPAQRRPSVLAELTEEHIRTVGGIDRAVELGVVDAVVTPAATRGAVASALADALTRSRPDKNVHGNIPL
ncbi:acetyl-CoA carboxylase, carboxyltransferase component (subunits alpha and beta) [Frankia casuarinae]|uniref:Propionyl-CoA carboxylase n=2 Tax=Frankia casuarinae (strain DSM 45818 / CECT 9043 / HFP020203 / CcI3) TaxID=106370 RepID=Q2J7A4_FRACC|nr:MULTISPECIES: carboxyl transferase domain-containing protein [Frankia]ABD12838.1 Propionyl-CoA carboxylase [Frankia casuarinae]ETA03294.1 acetyl-CoA carboxylase, carboxyltransferase component (subunits alpha and beta) [Frankia sp. CcI6]EYT92686.1 acetyl-CoA carboxylase, carboxyltransferase component (subunits alpha and beta) [Frankia casuarinae]KDA43621.1 acetyl-CoA carboxylase, carboxyltransferase component (subunits alpha and beta) [Frankia sp. BMG5.23]TFE26013.1 acyl-CoA carboxylase subu